MVLPVKATNDIKRYVTQYNPTGLEYSREQKGYLPTREFKPVLTQGHINEYMDLLSGLVSQTIPVTLIAEPHIAAVQLPDRAVKPEVVRNLIQACRKQQAIDITYRSMNNPKPHQRQLSPHTLIYTGFRWHVRGFCHKNEQYRDFVISRISKISPSGQGYIGIEHDQHWSEEVTLEIVPNSNLSKEQQALISNDFMMKNGTLKLTTRQALAHYTLHRYQVASQPEEIRNATQFPLELRNKNMIKPFLFEQ